MRIQGKRVWIAGQFIAAQMEIEDGVISRIHGYGAGPADQDYGDKRIVPGFIDIHKMCIRDRYSVWHLSGGQGGNLF